MAETIGSRFKSAWNAFMNKRDQTFYTGQQYYGSVMRPDRTFLNYGNERSIVTAIYNRISVDVSSITIKHVRTYTDEKFQNEIKDGLDDCLKLNANKDQTGRQFIQDAVLSLLDEGCVAIVPTDATSSPEESSSYDILEMRTAKILEWYPSSIKVRIFNETTGKKQDIIVPKSTTAIIENPFYTVMNAPNSTMKRLVRKLALLDMTDEKNSSGKLDLIVQLPYVIKSPARKRQAEERRSDIEMQLAGSKYGIAYTDGTEKITQLNRSVDNQLMSQIEYLTSMLYSQLGITAEILNGTANEQAMLNYTTRIIEPIISAITDEMKRKFISKTARTQGQTIMYYRDPFKLVPVNNLADIADKFTRNEILTSNEVRGIIGFTASDDPGADELRNKNINQSAYAEATQAVSTPEQTDESSENEDEPEVANEHNPYIPDDEYADYEKFLKDPKNKKYFD